MSGRHDTAGGGGSSTTTRGAIGLGTFSFTGQLSPVTFERAAATVDAFVSAGGRYVETAPSYEHDAIDLARLLRRHRRDDLVLATKCVAGGGSVARQIDGELRRLGVEYLDVVQVRVRRVDSVEAVADALVELARARQAGHVRSIGLSRVTAPMLEALAGGPRIDLVQNRLSVIHREEHPEELVTQCGAMGVALTPCQVLERGQLCDVSVPPAARTATDIRSRKSEYREPVHSVVRRWVAGTLIPLAREHGLSAEQLAIGWAATRSHVRTVVVGAGRPDQIWHALATPDRVPRELLAAVDAAHHALAGHVRTEFGTSLDQFRGGERPTPPCPTIPV